MEESRVTPHRDVPAHRITSLQKEAHKLDMKKILLLTGVLTLLTTTGCLVSEGGYYEHEHEHWHGHAYGHAGYETHSEVIAPVVVARPPVIVVRPPEIIIH